MPPGIPVVGAPLKMIPSGGSNQNLYTMTSPTEINGGGATTKVLVDESTGLAMTTATQQSVGGGMMTQNPYTVVPSPYVSGGAAAVSVPPRYSYTR